MTGRHGTHEDRRLIRIVDDNWAHILHTFTYKSVFMNNLMGYEYSTRNGHSVTADICSFCHIGKRVAPTRLFAIWPIYVRHQRVKPSISFVRVGRDLPLVWSTLFYVFSSTIVGLILIQQAL